MNEISEKLIMIVTWIHFIHLLAALIPCIRIRLHIMIIFNTYISRMIAFTKLLHRLFPIAQIQERIVTKVYNRP